MEEQRRYWAKDPEAYRAYSNQRRKDYHRWRMMTDPEYVLYHRQKSKRRKALLKSSVGIQLTGRQVRQRFGEFGNVCAYCGAGGVDLHIEHVVPISRGGTHTLGNIVPACQSCNFNKSTHEVEAWYRSQPFFCERRWKKVCRVLGWAKSSTGQLALL
ncbi:MAG: HNH endonuclease [Cyanobacteriota bacterium]|nr:HNH endonuclease [Cyanobacteriota bacterium]